MSTDRSSTGKSGIGRNGAGRRPGIRRSLEALGLAAAIALGGITVISPEEAHAAGISRPLVIQPSPVQVQTVESTDDEQ
ncbi:hypothetical protein [Propionibacterium acidifaciens]|uniref:Uncharacterized protein n=1 Tax=Propionibacterium acidifaciens F0233 TaxID=553198 RepID=U2PWT9_9ACTN|nr:hypothetical protein [Propionibacterium acidifaciens]AYW77948.1 hypothetical protein EGX94_07585 [Propionibacterium acidifaciens]ERK54950.1 hypothetical protein HMPREF0682_1693 [Propionibacterium acidifaciens F0233]